MDESYGTMIKLMGPNYHIQKHKMEDLLNCKDLYDTIEGDTTKPKDKYDEQENYWVHLSMG